MDLTLEDFKIRIDENEKVLRKLSDMQDFYADKEAVADILKHRDPIIYRVYACEAEEGGGLSYAIATINSGDVGGEFYMTKGHFHKKPIALCPTAGLSTICLHEIRFYTSNFHRKASVQTMIRFYVGEARHARNNAFAQHSSNHSGRPSGIVRLWE